MTDRNDIMPKKNGWRRLSYTTRCGFVDWGHALPGSAESLINQLKSEMGRSPGMSQMDITLSGRPAFVVDYGQSMGSGAVEMSLIRHWVVRRNLSDTQRERVALGIFMSASHDFEIMQGSFPFSLKTADSSYSAEDLVSNLIGFYTALRSKEQKDLRALCGEVSVEESLRIWDTYVPKGLGAIKNKTTKPVQFPTEEGNGDISFPPFLETVSPEPPGVLWVKPLGSRFIDGFLVNDRVPLDFDSDGKMRIQPKAYAR